MIKTEQYPVTDGINFRSIQDTRFKTLRIAVNFMLPLEKETAAANALLPFLLSRASREYPDFTRLNERLSEMYGAAIHADVRKLGEVQVLSIAVAGLADRYTLEGESISAELSHLLCSILFDPPLVGGLFPQDGFDQEKRQTIEMIDSDYNDKRTFARLRCEQLMCDREAFGINRYGSREDVTALQREEMTKVWERVLRTSRVEIMALGDCDPVPIYDSFLNAFKKLDREPVPELQTEIIKEVAKLREFTDTIDVAQSKLVLGLRAGAAVPKDAVASTKLMSAVFGGTPSSKLFLNVREKLSLCYYCSSRYDWNKGILLIESGVETENIDRAQTEILGQLDEIRAGKVTEEELQAAKLSIGNSYRTVGDYLGGLESWYVSQAFCEMVQSPEEAAEEISSVTMEQVVQAANHVVLDTVYRMVGKEGAEE
ncbi:EF-P 5-aminopentanol modification-associated protein YfmF [Faecalispora anaeroviscerum]|uniref:EF-P 5-aminopentanol modification-associated protein YfmF n=1 Tax=Faecalispora anaeroviscerum TaxID=2991836 RepID=UPI0024BBC76E|nr:insulinase family protein [Faecalispora anaeroviscerum]